jgi:hypothetical protein
MFLTNAQRIADLKDIVTSVDLGVLARKSGWNREHEVSLDTSPDEASYIRAYKKVQEELDKLTVPARTQFEKLLLDGSEKYNAVYQNLIGGDKAGKSAIKSFWKAVRAGIADDIKDKNSYKKTAGTYEAWLRKDFQTDLKLALETEFRRVADKLSKAVNTTKQGHEDAVAGVHQFVESQFVQDRIYPKAVRKHRLTTKKYWIVGKREFSVNKLFNRTQAYKKAIADKDADFTGEELEAVRSAFGLSHSLKRAVLAQTKS